MGAGPVGLLLALDLSARKHDVSVVARGTRVPQLNALYNRNNIEFNERLPEETELLVFAVKTQALCAAVRGTAGLLAAGAEPLFVHNGLPFWFGSRVSVAVSVLSELLDPDGLMRAHLGERACFPTGLLFAGAALDCGGALAWNGAGRLDLAFSTPTVNAAFAGAGLLPVGYPAKGEAAIFSKVIANCCFAPLAVLTGLSNSRIAASGALRGIQQAIGHELLAIATAMGLPLDLQIEALIEGGAAFGPDFKASMLIDIEQGRPTEYVAQLVGPCLLGRAFGLEPTTLFTLTRLIEHRLTNY